MRKHDAPPPASILLIVALAASVVLASCWHPLFDPEISASEVLANRLGGPVASFKISNIQAYYARDAWFVPQRADVSAAAGWYGLLARTKDDTVVSSIVYWFGDYGYQNITQEIDRTFGALPFLSTAPNGIATAAGIINDDNYALWYMDTGTVDTATALPPNDFILGAGGVGKTGAASDSSSLFYVVAGSPQYESVDNFSVPVFAGGSSISLPALEYASSSGTFFDTGTYLYLSCGLTDGTQAVFRWESAYPTLDPVRYPAAYGPLIAALSDGRLLASNGIVTTVLSPGMKKLFSFPSGKLRFVHERYDAALLYNICVFTRTVFVQASDGDDWGTVRIEVFEIPTAQLHKLGT